MITLGDFLEFLDGLTPEAALELHQRLARLDSQRRPLVMRELTGIGVVMQEREAKQYRENHEHLLQSTMEPVIEALENLTVQERQNQIRKLAAKYGVR